MEPLAALFGRRLRALRNQRGLTQEELGRAVRLDPKFIGAIERAERAPSFPAIERIAAALKVEVHEFFLPDRLSTGGIQQSLDVLKKDAGRLDPKVVKQFFLDLHAAIRRVEDPPVP